MGNFTFGDFTGTLDFVGNDLLASVSDSCKKCSRSMEENLNEPDIVKRERQAIEIVGQHFDQVFDPGAATLALGSNPTIETCRKASNALGAYVHQQAVKAQKHLKAEIRRAKRLQRGM